MESKHSPPTPTSPDTYTENYRGFTLTLLTRPATATNRAGDEFRAVAMEAVSWCSTWRLSWAAALVEVRGLVDRYLDAREACARIVQRRQLAAAAGAAGAGAVDLPPRRPVVR